VEQCGDFRLDPQEECDDGNRVSSDGCQASCRLPVCGDGIRDPGEQCDDGNTTAHDGCDATCRIEVAVCGDGYTDEPEQCDDGNLEDGDGCDSACRIEAKSAALPIFVNAGGVPFTETSGRVWMADTPFANGGTGETVSKRPINRTQLDGLYFSTRYGEAGGPPLTFQIPVPEAGLYTVRLHFAEVTDEANNRTRRRVFDVEIEGAPWIRDFEVLREAQRNTAVVRSIAVNVMDGMLTVRLVPRSGRPMLSAIEVHRAAETAPLPIPARPAVSCRRCN